MPGLFDNAGQFLSGFGGILGGLGRGLNNAQTYQSFANQYGAPAAQQMVGAPQVYEANRPQIHQLGTDANGLPVFGTFNPTTGQISPINLQGMGGSQPQPPGAPQSNQYTPGPTPPGVNPVEWRKKEADRIAELESRDRDTATGSIEFLNDAIPFKDKLDSGYFDKGIGPIIGDPSLNRRIGQAGSVVNTLNTILPSGMQIPNPSNQAYDLNREFNAGITTLSQRGLKAVYGARPSQWEAQQNKDTYGSATANPGAARNILSNRVQLAWDKVQRGLNTGLISPSEVPASIRDRGIQEGRLNPGSFGMSGAPQQQQPRPAGQPQVQSQPSQQPASGGGQTWTDPHTGKSYKVINGKLYQ